MRAYRIALKEFGRTKREVFSGLSGYYADGRWHSKGRLLDYAAASVSLAVLERLVHFKSRSNLKDHVICSVDIPDELIIDAASLGPIPRDWRKVGCSRSARRIGDRWHFELMSPALRVPSAVVPNEANLLLNAGHPAWRWTWVGDPKAFSFDDRLFKE